MHTCLITHVASSRSRRCVRPTGASRPRHCRRLFFLCGFSSPSPWPTNVSGNASRPKSSSNLCTSVRTLKKVTQGVVGLQVLLGTTPERCRWATGAFAWAACTEGGYSRRVCWTMFWGMLVMSFPSVFQFLPHCRPISIALVSVSQNPPRRGSIVKVPGPPQAFLPEPAPRQARTFLITNAVLSAWSTSTSSSNGIFEFRLFEKCSIHRRWVLFENRRQTKHVRHTPQRVSKLPAHS